MFNLKLNMKREVFLLSVFLSAINIIVFGVFFTTSIVNSEIDKAKNNLYNTNKNIKIFLERLFSENSHAMSYFVEQDEFKNIFIDQKKNRKKISEQFHRINRINKDITYIYAGFNNGLMIINDYNLPQNYDPRKRPWYEFSMKNQQESELGISYRDASTNEWVLTQCKIIKDEESKIIGVLAIDIANKSVLELLRKNYNYKTQKIYLINKEGYILVHADEKLIGKRITNLNKFINNDKRFFEYRVRNQQYWGYHDQLDITNWVIVSSVSKNEILKPIRLKIVLLIGTLVLLAIGIGILQSFLLYGRLAKPMVTLGKKIYDISHGIEVEYTEQKNTNYEMLALSKDIETIAKKVFDKKAGEMQAIIESVTDGILVFDNQWNVLYANSQFKKMWNINNEELAQKDNLFISSLIARNLQQPENLEKKFLDFYELINCKSLTLNLKDNRCIEQSVCPYIIDNQIGGYVFVYDDVTEQLKTKEMMIEAEQKTAALAMAITANHEINQPLMILLGHIELLENKLEDDSSIHKHLAKMKESIDRINFILTNMRMIEQREKISFKNYLSDHQMVSLTQKKDQ